jgi:hypothetical protein
MCSMQQAALDSVTYFKHKLLIMADKPLLMKEHFMGKIRGMWNLEGLR